MRILLLGAALLAVTACGRPMEVRSLAGSALPLAVDLKSSGSALQARFGQQRSALEGRSGELIEQAALARAYTSQIEKDWRFSATDGDKSRARQLAMLREEDAALLADPLAQLVGTTASVSKPPAWDFGALNKVITGLDGFKQERKPDILDLTLFFKGVNDELKKLDDEQTASAPAATPTP